jgi:hypothetical protein
MFSNTSLSGSQNSDRVIVHCESFAFPLCFLPMLGELGVVFLAFCCVSFFASCCSRFDMMPSLEVDLDLGALGVLEMVRGLLLPPHLPHIATVRAPRI